MVDLAVFSGALASITGLIKAANESKNFEWTSKLIEIQQKVIELQGAYASLQNANRELAEENRRLKEAKDLESRAIFEHGVYWLAPQVQYEVTGESVIEVSERPMNGPYCPSCWDLDQKLVRLQIWNSGKPGNIDFYCPHHKNTQVFYGIPRDRIMGYDKW